MWNLSLKIETGRYNNITVQLSICEFCDLNEVENELHFVSLCTLCENFRFYQLVWISYSEFSNLDNESKCIYPMAKEQTKLT